MLDVNVADAWWLWLAAGFLLMALEMLAPGTYLLWIGAAALATGLVTLLTSPDLPLQVALFGVLAVAGILAAKRWLRGRVVTAADPLMNRRGARLVGQVATVAEAIRGGAGRVRIGDGEWLAEGPDCEPGARVRVVAVEGTAVRIEPLEP